MFYIWWTLARRPQTDSVSRVIFFQSSCYSSLHRWTRSVAPRRLIPLSSDKSSIHSRHSRQLVGRIQGQLLENGWYTRDQLYSCEQSWETKNSRSQLHDADIRFYSHSKAQESLCNIFILARMTELRQRSAVILSQSLSGRAQNCIYKCTYNQKYTCHNSRAQIPTPLVPVYKSPQNHMLQSRRLQLHLKHGHQCQSDIFYSF